MHVVTNEQLFPPLTQITKAKKKKQKLKTQLCNFLKAPKTKKYWYDLQFVLWGNIASLWRWPTQSQKLVQEVKVAPHLYILTWLYFYSMWDLSFFQHYFLHILWTTIYPATKFNWLNRKNCLTSTRQYINQYHQIPIVRWNASKPKAYGKMYANSRAHLFSIPKPVDRILARAVSETPALISHLFYGSNFIHSSQGSDDNTNKKKTFERTNQFKCF